LFTLGAFAFETREIHWSGELIFAMAWLVLVLSIAAVGLMYWLIRRSASTGFASLFYLVPAVTAFFAFILFGERLDALSILGMVICAGGVVLANRGAAKAREFLLLFPPLDHELGLCHQRAKPAIAARDAGLPDHGGTPSMEGRAFRLRHIAYRNRSEEICLALDRGRRLTGLEIGSCRRATEIVGEGHECAAMHNSEAIVEVIARNELCGHTLRRYVSDLEAEEFGKGRLIVGRFIHMSCSQRMGKRVRARTLKPAPLLCNLRSD
jgi:hypothetical protein